MSAADTATTLSRFPGRGAGTNAERRAAGWLSQELRAGRRQAVIETFWCRPNWALAHAWHALLALIGGLVSVASPKVGGVLVLIALVSVLLDGLTGRSLGRRLTPERASQNVVSPGPEIGATRAPAAAEAAPRVRLIVTAAYDTGRMGMAYRSSVRRPVARLRALAGPLTPGWLGWLAIGCLWLLVVAFLRDRGGGGTPLAVLQFVPTVGLLIGLALLLDLAGSGFGPGTADAGSAAGLAIALVRALDASPPRRLSVELVLQGAGDGTMLGLRRHLRARRRELTPPSTIVLGIGPCGAGTPRWWTGDGPLLPLRYLPRLRQLAATAAQTQTTPATAHTGRGTSPAYPARLAGLPSITIGCLDHAGLIPGSHLPADVPEALERGAGDGLLEFALMLVDAIDADLTAARPAAAGEQRTAA